MALNWKIIHSEIKNGIKNFNFRPYELARKLGVSISYLNEFVWGNYGVRLGKLIETYKLDKAIDLLSPGAKVKDVFKDCGYWRLRSFRRAFKRRLGISPSEFKQIIVNSYDENLVKKYKEILWGGKRLG